MHELMGHGDGTANGEDQYILDTQPVRDLIALTREVVAQAASAAEACDQIRPHFAQLLADENWLPDEYQQDAPESGMGGGIGQWLLFRAGDGSLSLFSLVVPPEATAMGIFPKFSRAIPTTALMGSTCAISGRYSVSFSLATASGSNPSPCSTLSILRISREGTPPSE